MDLKFKVNSPKVEYTKENIIAEYEYQTQKVTKTDNDSGPQYNVSMAAKSY